MQIRLVQIEQMAATQGGLALRGDQGGQLRLCLRVMLTSRREAWTRPTPAHLVQGAPDTAVGEDQAEASRQESGEQGDTPAGLDMARTGRRLARLRVHNPTCQGVLGGRPLRGSSSSPATPCCS
jgi:hypothetical protein